MRWLTFAAVVCVACEGTPDPSGTGGGSASSAGGGVAGTGGGVAATGGGSSGGGDATGGGSSAGGGVATGGGSSAGGGVATGGGSSAGGGSATGGGTGGGSQPGQNWFAMDCSQDATCGFGSHDNRLEGVNYNTSIVPGLCPSGRSAFRIAFIAGSTIPSQFYMGLTKQGIGTPVVQGMTIYGRWRARAQNRAAGPNGPDVAGKFLMIGDSGNTRPGHTRMILNLRDNQQTPQSDAYEISRNIDGAAHGVGLQEVTYGGWAHGQFRVRSSSAIAPLVNLVRNGTVGTATTTRPHTYTTGQRVEVRYAPQYWEAVHTITVVDSTHFTFPIDASAEAMVLPTPGGPLTSMTADAHIALWLGAANASEATPTGQSNQEFGISTESWGASTRFGGYLGIGSSTVWSPAPIFELCDMQLGPSFDPRWNIP